MTGFNSAKWIKQYKQSLINEKDKSVKLKDLLHTEPVDGKFDKTPKIKRGAENDLAIEKDKEGSDIFAKGLKEAFTPGDMWSNDFDYTGMLRYSVEMEIPEDPNALLGMIDTLKALSDSYEDVNYHSENQDLGNAIEYIEDAKGVEDLERAKDFLEMHQTKANKTLKDLTRGK